MVFDEAWLDLVPGRAEFPLGLRGQVEEDFGRAVNELETFGVPVNVDALSWVFRLAGEEQHASLISSSVPWLDRLAVGFFDPELGEEPGFGFIAYSSIPIDDMAMSNTGLAIEFDDVIAIGEDLTHEVDGRAFRTVVRVGRREPQVDVTSPSAARATAAARTRRLGLDGWLVPRHSVDVAAPVKFSDGAIGHVVEDWGECIDAALVGVAPSGLRGLAPAACVRGISPSTTVEVVDRGGLRRRQTIMDVDINVGVVRSHLFPIRFTYDWASSASGDSGALVVADPCGEPLGMHQGVISIMVSGSRVRRAYGLCLYQLEDHGGLQILI